MLTFINTSTIYENIFTNITASFFNTVTFMSTTGYTLHDYGAWPPLSQLLVFFMSFIGGMAGSTTGGIKLIRTILVVKYIKSEISRMIHPRGLYNVKIGKNVIDDDIIRGTLGFYLFYILIFVACTLLISLIIGCFIQTPPILTVGCLTTTLGILNPRKVMLGISRIGSIGKYPLCDVYYMLNLCFIIPLIFFHIHLSYDTNDG